jgi:hypothetical protein
MHTISFSSFPTMKLNIHNECLDFKLKDQKYLSYDAGWKRYSVRETKVDSMMSIEFKFSLETFEGIVMYELRREYAESTTIQLFVAWKSEGYKKFCTYVHLLECDESFVWNETRLKEYYQRYTHRLCTYTSPIKNTWVIHDGTVLVTELALNFMNRDGRLNVTISEGIKDDYTKMPMGINPEL